MFDLKQATSDLGNGECSAATERIFVDDGEERNDGLETRK